MNLTYSLKIEPDDCLTTCTNKRLFPAILVFICVFGGVCTGTLRCALRVGFESRISHEFVLRKEINNYYILIIVMLG